MIHTPASVVCMPLVWVLGVLLLLTTRPGMALTLHHVHGVSYSVDGKRLYIPMHHGLAVYNGSQWTKVPGPEHDYMGFAVTRQFWYSSGHPMPGSPLKNPLGLIKSKDQGQTWELLGLSGEADFHLMATSYQTNTVYVVNPSPNSRMPQPGLYYTTNDGKQWHHGQKHWPGWQSGQPGGASDPGESRRCWDTQRGVSVPGCWDEFPAPR